jgi:hypothetical protein
MATTTPNYDLVVADGDDFIAVDSQLGDNFSILDTELKRVDDLASNPAGINGRLWRTSGFQALPDAGVDIDFEASRVSGGMTASSGNQGLIIPVDGHYDIRLIPYATGGATPWAARFQVIRARSSVSDKAIIHIGFWKEGADDLGTPGSDIIPLKANDTLTVKGFSTGGIGSTWGTDEVSGIRLHVEYKRPLGGVTPV